MLPSTSAVFVRPWPPELNPGLVGPTPVVGSQLYSVVLSPLHFLRATTVTLCDWHKWPQVSNSSPPYQYAKAQLQSPGTAKTFTHKISLPAFPSRQVFPIIWPTGAHCRHLHIVCFSPHLFHRLHRRSLLLPTIEYNKHIATTARSDTVKGNQLFRSIPAEINTAFLLAQ